MRKYAVTELYIDVIDNLRVVEVEDVCVMTGNEIRNFLNEYRYLDVFAIVIWDTENVEDVQPFIDVMNKSEHYLNEHSGTDNYQGFDSQYSITYWRSAQFGNQPIKTRVLFKGAEFNRHSSESWFISYAYRY